MQNIIDKLKDNLQVIYRRGLDADKSLSSLQQQGKGKYQHVFADDAVFNVKSKRFQPYIEELAKDIVQIENADEATVKERLPLVIKKMELLFTTLAQLQDSLKS
ncbi:primosomal replication protein PriC [Neptunicella sp. SCSIO 80796]|uniref:primosomal replication protein PriC n=1 Tax=Neptunicella plasticusilytica TaxID=3117012 RepID=UPI003A4E620C